ncbi:hypothetical protein HYQ46_003618 [Verticillium longisporum]|nr:hypothetical protein HYQ46_003618 [Verticillium longisporum]
MDASAGGVQFSPSCTIVEIFPGNRPSGSLVKVIYGPVQPTPQTNEAVNPIAVVNSQRVAVQANEPPLPIPDVHIATLIVDLAESPSSLNIPQLHAQLPVESVLDVEEHAVYIDSCTGLVDAPNQSQGAVNSRRGDAAVAMEVSNIPVHIVIPAADYLCC